MSERSGLAHDFEGVRGHLRAVAFRMLGSVADADDAVQEAWLRASSAETRDIDNVPGWLTTIVSRICLDVLRARERRHEEHGATELRLADPEAWRSPEEELGMFEAVGLAMLVVLDQLSPLERVAFVLHDMFSVPFEDIARIVERSPVATKKLASRARHRVQGAEPPSGHASHHALVEAFLAAARTGAVDELIAMLAPDVVRRVDDVARGEDAPPELRGAEAVAKETAGNARRAQFARPILVDGALGAIVAPRGRPRLVLRFAFEGHRICALDVVGDRAALQRMTFSLLRT